MIDTCACLDKVDGLEHVPRTGAWHGNRPRLVVYLWKEEQEKSNNNNGNVETILDA